MRRSWLRACLRMLFGFKLLNMPRERRRNDPPKPLSMLDRYESRDMTGALLLAPLPGMPGSGILDDFFYPGSFAPQTTSGEPVRSWLGTLADGGSATHIDEPVELVAAN